MIQVKHIRSDEDTWDEYNPVIPDGELALIRRDGGYDVKIGDGVRRFSQLPPLIGRHTVDTETEEVSATVSHLDHTCFGIVWYLTLTLDYTDQPNFTAIVSFTTDDPEPLFEITNGAGIYFSGADVEDGVFVPQMFMKYTLLFWRDDVLNCHVRGVYVG